MLVTTPATNEPLENNPGVVSQTITTQDEATENHLDVVSQTVTQDEAAENNGDSVSPPVTQGQTRSIYYQGNISRPADTDQTRSVYSQGDFFRPADEDLIESSKHRPANEDMIKSLKEQIKAHRTNNRADLVSQPAKDQIKMQPTNNQPDLVYQRANMNQITQSFTNHSQVWSPPLALKDYMHMQYHLAQVESSVENTAYWVLFDRQDPETIISSCTTIMRDVIVNDGQGMRPAKAAVITHVFTHPAHRMKGMATRLLKQVQRTIDTKTDHDIEFSVVYSDAYTEFFSNLGWTPHPANQLRIVLGNVPSESPAFPGLTPLDDKNLKGVLQDDLTLSKLRISGKRDGAPHVQFLPTQHLAKWHMLRSEIYSQHLAKGKQRPLIHGALYRDVDAWTAAWTWWVHDFQHRRLCLCRMVMTRHKGMDHAVGILLWAAMAEAAAWGFREVTLWDPTPQAVSGAKRLADQLGRGTKAIEEERTEMIPCFRWKGDEEKETVWEDKQYYAWC